MLLATPPLPPPVDSAAMFRRCRHMPIAMLLPIRHCLRLRLIRRCRRLLPLIFDAAMLLSLRQLIFARHAEALLRFTLLRYADATLSGQLIISLFTMPCFRATLITRRYAAITPPCRHAAADVDVFDISLRR